MEVNVSDAGPLLQVVIGRAELPIGGASGLEAGDQERLNHFNLAMTGTLPAQGQVFGSPLPDLPEAVILAAAAQIMQNFGERPALTLFARLGSILVRAASQVRAQDAPQPSDLRFWAGAQDVAVAAYRQPYAHFFALEEVDVSWRRFDGTMNAAVTRAAFVSGDAVTVLPYDPVRDRVLVIEQFRAGPFLRGDPQPWLIEAIAGRVDPGETPAEAARREAVEEAGLSLGALHEVAGYYPSPGAKTEFLYSYVAITDLPDGTAGVFGLAEENEDIRGHLIGFEQLMALVGSGEIANASLIMTALWLSGQRDRLRADKDTVLSPEPP